MNVLTYSLSFKIFCNNDYLVGQLKRKVEYSGTVCLQVQFPINVNVLRLVFSQHRQIILVREKEKEIRKIGKEKEKDEKRRRWKKRKRKYCTQHHELIIFK